MLTTFTTKCSPQEIIMKEIRDNARKLMGKKCRVCPECNGKVCAGEVPGMGGTGSGSAFKNNFEALRAVHLKMRLIHDVVDPSTEVEVFGHTMSLPVFPAPIGGIMYNMDDAIPEKDYANAIIEGSFAGGIIGTTGDGVPESIHQAGFTAISSANGKGIPFIKPWDDEELFQKLDGAKATGTDIIGMDIDAAGLITLRLQGRPVSPKTPEKLREIIDYIGCKFILKGVMTVEDAELALAAGADAIVVSDHGGRVFDHTPGTADVLPEIAQRVKGKMTILVDGGIRAGADVLKMIALGADAVLIGRPFSVAAIGGGKEGVEAYIKQLTTELKQAMVLTGTADLKTVSSDIIC